MTGIVAVVADKPLHVATQSVVESVAQTSDCRTQATSTDKAAFAVASPPVSAGEMARLYESEAYVGMLFGEPVSEVGLDWDKLLERLFQERSQAIDLARLHGAFAVIGYEKATGALRVVTDSFGFQPVYLAKVGDRTIVSTALAPFLRFADPVPEPDPRWIQEYLFFNYPPLGRTLLKGVTRLPAGTVTAVGPAGGSALPEQYVPILERDASRMSRSEEVERMLSLFQSVVPDWLNSNSAVAFSLSRGLDSRAVLASIPESAMDTVSTFTYGIPDSSEIVEARNLSSQLGYRHLELFLNDEYLARLPSLMHETVFMSDALQVINRSNLPLVYGSVLLDGARPGSIMSGVSGDHVFRDHISAYGNVPYLISADVAAMHRTGERRVDDDFYRSMFGESWSDIGSYLMSVLDDVEETYGQFGDPDAYYRYLMYVAGSRYFGGQAAIANRYTTFRSPYWDRRMVQFGMDARLGTVGLSQHAGQKDSFLETMLQANVVASHPVLRKVPYMNLPVTVFGSNSRLPYEWARITRKLTTILTGRKSVPEEDWYGWYRTVLKNEIDELLGENSRVAAHVQRSFIDQQREAVDIHWLGKLITIEIALRLIETGWRIAVDG